uniref:Uncharacterized protein n=1 Tax=Anopheles melas TaxID=34690 RepID=A0A182TME8_9DIPT
MNGWQLATGFGTVAWVGGPAPIGWCGRPKCGPGWLPRPGGHPLSAILLLLLLLLTSCAGVGSAAPSYCERSATSVAAGNVMPAPAALFQTLTRRWHTHFGLSTGGSQFTGWLGFLGTLMVVVVVEEVVVKEG